MKNTLTFNINVRLKVTTVFCILINTIIDLEKEFEGIFRFPTQKGIIFIRQQL